MSLFQCDECGCCDNTVTGMIAYKSNCQSTVIDWTGIEHLQDKDLCCACAPATYTDGTPTGYGEWHNEFPRVFLEKGAFHTNPNGNLEHTATGRTDYAAMAVDQPI